MENNNNYMIILFLLKESQMSSEAANETIFENICSFLLLQIFQGGLIVR